MLSGGYSCNLCAICSFLISGSSTLFVKDLILELKSICLDSVIKGGRLFLVGNNFRLVGGNRCENKKRRPIYGPPF